MAPTHMTHGTVLSADSLTKDKVVDTSGEKLGKLDDIMIDTTTGRIAYAVLSVGGLFGMGDKLFAIPWEAFRLDRNENELVLNIRKEQLENAPGFDKDNWPDFADRTWGMSVHRHYGTTPTWE